MYEVRPDVFMNNLHIVFEVADRLTQKGVVLHHLELYRHGAEIPNEWEGQHYRTKAITWGDPNDPGQVWFAVRSEYEEEDKGWWIQAMVRMRRANSTSLPLGGNRS